METAVKDTGDTGTDEGFDMEQGVADLGEAIFGKDAADDTAVVTETDAVVENAADPAVVDPNAAVVDPNAAPATPAVRAAPKAWPRDKHEIWSKLTPDAQEYLELREKQMLDGLDQYKDNAKYGASLKEIIGPYMPLLQARGMEPAQAVQSLLNAQFRLTNGSVDARRAAYKHLGESLGLIPPQTQGKANGADSEQPPAIDPRLQQELDSVKSRLDAADQAAIQQRRERVSEEVNSFADKHPMFDECADDIAALIQTGLSLEDAYQKAIWANPVTRQKELDRIATEAAANKAKKQRDDLEKARNATAANVNAKQTRKAPTAPVGKDLGDTMTETLAEIRSRPN